LGATTTKTISKNCFRLGKLDTTVMYIQIAETLFQHEPDAFTVKVARTKEEITAHMQVGFEWIGERDGLVFLRKRK
jgi:hypothetical protein